METLYANFYQSLESTPMDFFRDSHDSINGDKALADEIIAKAENMMKAA